MNVIKSEDYTRLTLEAKAHYNFNVNSVKILNNIVFIICNTKQHPLNLKAVFKFLKTINKISPL